MAEQSNTPNEKRTPDPGTLGSALSDLAEEYKKLREDQALRMQALGGPRAYVAHVAPRVLSLFNGPLTERQAMSENDSGWATADKRVSECANCPAIGGACANSDQPGERVELNETGLVFLPCQKFERWRVIERQQMAEVPESLFGVTLDDLFERVEGYPRRDELRRWIGAVRRRQPSTSFLLTGGHHTRRTALLGALSYQFASETRLKKLRIRYTYGPKLYAELREYYDDAGDDPLAACKRADVLFFDFLDPSDWKEWFIQRIDLLLWERLGGCKPTVISTVLNRDAFLKTFKYTSTWQIGELSITDPALGPFRGDE